MRLFGTIFKTVVDVAVMPVSIAVDVVTLGGTTTDPGSAVIKKLEDIKEDLDELTD